MQNSSTTLRIAGTLFLAVLVTLFGTPALAGGKPKPADAEELVISEVFVDESAAPATVLISGRFLDNGDYLSVRLGYLGELTVASANADFIEAELPETYEDGNYRLSVQTGDSGNQYNEFEITIGAVGPEGPPGPAGPEGPPGPVEPDCELEERIFQAVEGFEWDPTCPAPSDADRDGYKVEDGDCDDRDAQAHPGQTDWLAEAMRDGGYDYNCDGIEDKQYAYNGDCTLNNVGQYTLESDLACGESGHQYRCGKYLESYDCSENIFYPQTCYRDVADSIDQGVVTQGCH